MTTVNNENPGVSVLPSVLRRIAIVLGDCTGDRCSDSQLYSAVKPAFGDASRRVDVAYPQGGGLGFFSVKLRENRESHPRREKKLCSNVVFDHVRGHFMTHCALIALL